MLSVIILIKKIPPTLQLSAERSTAFRVRRHSCFKKASAFKRDMFKALPRNTSAVIFQQVLLNFQIAFHQIWDVAYLCRLKTFASLNPKRKTVAKWRELEFPSINLNLSSASARLLRL